MEFVRGLHNIKPHHKGCILTIGNFDGFHRGHQLLIKILREEGFKYKLPVVAMIFEPQPREYFNCIVPSRLTGLRDKIRYLYSAGVDIVLCVAFNKNFSEMKACNFIQNVLIYKLGIRCICIGNDFKFGAYRMGDISFLERMAKREGFSVIPITTCFDKRGKRVSSTLIRTALQENRILDAEYLLGHSYCVSGKIIHGDTLGRFLGFPTANIFLKGQKLPIHGVYAVNIYGISDGPFPGIANVGTRPTISGNYEQRLEVHLLNMSVNLYDYYVTVVFLNKIRNEKCFDSLKNLKIQIKNDVIQVYDFFNRKLV